MTVMRIKDFGQTTVEYILLIGMIAIIAASLFPLIRDNMIGDGQCFGVDRDKVICRMLAFTALGQSGGNNGNGSGSFRRFTLLR